MCWMVIHSSLNAKSEFYCLTEAVSLYIMALCKPYTGDDLMISAPFSVIQLPNISAIYYALLQSGYDFYAFDRSPEHIAALHGFLCEEHLPAFFSETRQSTCDVYPFWPRAAILETASFYLDKNISCLINYEHFYHKIMSANNISEEERSNSLWKWIAAFPTALRTVIESNGFKAYLDWETVWTASYIESQSSELARIRECLDNCISRYKSPVTTIQLLINPIKCVYSADYHLLQSEFIYSSGALNASSVIHEFLHQILHPYIVQEKDMILSRGIPCSNIDQSYLLSGDQAGKLNAFEESAVRALTSDILQGQYPFDLSKYLGRFLQSDLHRGPAEW